MSKVNVTLDARLTEQGVVCMVKCDGQRAEITFTGTDVLFDVPEAAQAPADQRGGIEVEPDPADVLAP